MVRVSIVGINGVGMAHAIACEKSGHEVVAVLDSDLSVGVRLCRAWTNVWGPYSDLVECPRSRPLFTNDVCRFREVDAELLIISCPTKFHIPYLLALGDRYPRILVEKPLAYTEEEVASVPPEICEKTWVGHKWLCHPHFPSLSFPLTILQGHPYPPEEGHKKECGVIWDLGTHAFAALLVSVDPSEWHQMVVDWAVVADKAATVGVRSSRGRTLIHVGYHTVGNGEVVVNDRELHWSEDIFCRQLEWVLRGIHPALFDLGVMVCTLVRGAIERYEQQSLCRSTTGLSRAE